jgi:hypothetical protein
MDKETLVNALVAADDARPRSRQKTVGVSSLGDCRRRVWHFAKGDVGTNPTSRLAAILGTAIHAHIEQAIVSETALIEHRIEIDGLPPATIDYFDTATGEVVDWKTIKLSGRDYFVSQQKRWQVQVYGYLLEKSGHTVKTVTLVGIPRDGDENDIIVYSEPYDPAIAEQALSWLDDVMARTEAPAPERDAVSFCQKYCQFYGSLCAGIPKDMAGEAITDNDATEAAKQYKLVSEQIKQLETAKDGLKAQLEGVSGVTIDGIKVSWSEIAGRKTPDTDEILKLLQTHFDESMTQLPNKIGAPSLRLTVK